MATQSDRIGNEVFMFRTDAGAARTVEDAMRAYRRGAALELAETALKVLEETTSEAARDLTKDADPEVAERAMMAAFSAFQAAKAAWGYC